jgi:probable HAF family extracellular repeat protein
LAAAFSAGLGFGAGASAQVPEHSYLIDLNTKTVTEIGALGSHTWASGINEAGQVVGSFETAGGKFHVFITGSNGVGLRDLGTLRGPLSQAHGINDAGQVAGYSSTAGGDYHAFITGANGMGMRDLGAVGANDINNVGQVVGQSGSHASLTGPNGMGMRDLGTLGGAFSQALGINDAGQVVGLAETAEGVAHAFITGPGGRGMMDLNSLVDVPGGVILAQATDINNAGQVIAIGIVPEPETYMLLLLGLALVGFIARRKKMDARAPCLE